MIKHSHASYTNDQRKHMASRIGEVMVGPWETGFCVHGKIYTFRWVWKPDRDPDEGEVNYKRMCPRCKEQAT